MYCPCMGRFGNQADHFLGVLAFAHDLNRTLVLPPWIEYRTGSTGSIQVPFDAYFKVEPLLEYHKVITMGRFMIELASTIWPKGKRKVFCYMARGEGKDCDAKEGNPFGPFWDHFSIDFDESIIYQPLHYDLQTHSMVEQWSNRFPAEEFPVLAFVGAPAAFPVREEHRELHRFMFWSARVEHMAREFILTHLPNGPFLGIHLRNGPDWVRACEHVESSPLLFAAPQCLGYRGEHGRLTQEMCIPSADTVARQVKQTVKKTKVKSVFVASDHDYMIARLNRTLKKLQVAVFSLEDANPHVDLAILGLSNHFIGNCVSSFSSFTVRERDVNGFPSSFWAFTRETTRPGHDEL